MSITNVVTLATPTINTATSTLSDAPLLTVRDLHVQFPFSAGWFRRGIVRAVDGVSFSIQPGETVGLVGESGCGKSTTARALLGLSPVTSGEIYWHSERIDGLSARRIRPYRRQMQMIFQDPMASLNPRMSVGNIIAEPMHNFRLLSREDRKFEVMRLMDIVGLDPRFLNRYPHEFSGGQRQRIGIARALSVQPKLIVCDEPVSALDVSIQAQVVNLLMDLQQRLGLSYLFISHDLTVVRHLAHRIGVMYLGRIVELAPAEDLFRAPQHPYTQALLSAIPIPNPALERKRQRVILRGEVPSPDKVYKGCPFAERCPIVEDACRLAPVPLLGEYHQVACIKATPDVRAKAAVRA